MTSASSHPGRGDYQFDDPGWALAFGHPVQENLEIPMAVMANRLTAVKELSPAVRSEVGMKALEPT
jgi:hypothetical protein